MNMSVGVASHATTSFNPIHIEAETKSSSRAYKENLDASNQATHSSIKKVEANLSREPDGLEKLSNTASENFKQELQLQLSNPDTTSKSHKRAAIQSYMGVKNSLKRSDLGRSIDQMINMASAFSSQDNDNFVVKSRII